MLPARALFLARCALGLADSSGLAEGSHLTPGRTPFIKCPPNSCAHRGTVAPSGEGPGPHPPRPPGGAEGGCGALKLLSWPRAALPEVVSSSSGAFPPPPSLRRSQVLGAGETPVPAPSAQARATVTRWRRLEGTLTRGCALSSAALPSAGAGPKVAPSARCNLPGIGLRWALDPPQSPLPPV